MGPGQQPWEVLSALPAWQLTEVPRAPQRRDESGPDERPSGDGAVQRAAELVSAYCRGAPVAVAWVRERAGGPVRVITAGPGLAAAAITGSTCSPCPRARGGGRCPAARLPGCSRRSGTGHRWPGSAMSCSPTRTRQAFRRAGGDGRPSLEDGLLSAWLGPFGWLLLAEPADEGTVDELTSEAALAQLEAQRSDSPRAKLAERRAAARHAGAAAGRLHRPVAGAPARRGRHPGAGRAGRRAAARLLRPDGPAVRAAARPARRPALPGITATVPPGGR